MIITMLLAIYLENMNHNSSIICYNHITHTFFMDLALQHFIYNWRNLAPVVHYQQELGMHTNIIEFQSLPSDGPTQVHVQWVMEFQTSVLSVTDSKP